MQKMLLHCGKKIASTSIYSIQNFEQFSQLFLFVGGPCPHCGKTAVGHAGLDVWGAPVLFDVDTSASTEKKERLHRNKFAVAGKKATLKYLRLIDQGVAQKINTLPKQYRNQRSGPVGVSEYSRRAAKALSNNYIFRIERIIAQSASKPPNKLDSDSRNPV